MLDNGVQPQGKWLAEELQKQGIQVSLIINSHFYPDHFKGNRFFPEAETWGSQNHAKTQYPYPVLQKELADGQVLTYVAYTFRFVATPGHCSHHLMVVINQQYVWIGDLLMTGYEGEVWIPYIAPDGDLQAYMRNIRLVKSLNLPLIAVHGEIMDTQQKLARVTEPYQYYLQRVWN